jgi:hypothetical protein
VLHLVYHTQHSAKPSLYYKPNHPVLSDTPLDSLAIPTKTSKMAKELVLITGVNGYIAAVAAKHFLDHGHSVRGSVRKASSAKALIEGPLKAYFDSGKFTIVEVPDITVEGNHTTPRSILFPDH